MRYVVARLEDEERETAYRYYVSTSLQLIPQSKYLTRSLDDMLNPEKLKIDTRTGDEIADDIMKSAGLTFG